MGSAYLAHPDFRRPLAEELDRRGIRIERWHDDLAITDAPAVPSVWAANVWSATEIVSVGSIADAARALTTRQRNWSMFAPVHRGRAKLIDDRLPHVSAKPLDLGAPAPTAPLGSWTLLDPSTLLLSAACTSPFPNGEPRFIEDRNGPPNRAYLKLWEALAVIGQHPRPGERCLDLGASPGGWTWTIARLGAEVLAIDRAPLASTVARLPGVSWRQGSAFGVDPADHGQIDWVFSDVIAYPDRLARLARRWVESGRTRHVVCTIKLQGATDHDAIDELGTIPGAVVRHLFHNKHEVTFAWHASATG